MSIADPRSAPEGDGERELLNLAHLLMRKPPFGVALLDAELRYILVNETLAGLHGLPAHEHKGRSVSEVVPRMAPAAIERMQRVIATGEALMNQEEVSGSTRPEGRRRFWTVSYSRVDLVGGGHGVCVVIQEITDRKEVEAREREARRDLTLAAGHVARLQAVTSSLSEAKTPLEVARIAVSQGVAALGGALGVVMLLDPTGTELHLLAQHGLPDDVPARYGRLLVNEDMPLCRALRAGAPEWIESHAEFAAAYPTVVGTVVSAPLTQAVASIPLTLHGRAIGALGVSFAAPRRFDEGERFFVLTLARQCAQALERARLYEAERRANERLTILAEASAIFASSLDYETTLASIARVAVPRFVDVCTLELLTPEAELTLVGLSHAEPSKEAGLRELRLLFPPRPDTSVLFRAIATRAPIVVSSVLDKDLVAMAQSDEHLQRLRDVCSKSYIIAPLIARGQAIGVMTLGRDRSAFEDPDDLALAEDLARRAALAIDSAKLYREAQEASRSKDEFLSVLSHELRTPLNAILGWAAILTRKREDPAALARGIQVIERNARAQVKIIEDILDVSRIITGKLRLDRRSLEVEAVVRASVEVLRPTADAKQVEIASAIEAGLPRIVGDPDRLQQVVWNLLSNAVKFTPKGGQVEIRVERSGASVVIRVSDTGPGISPEFLPYVFDRFRQADSSSSRAHGGLGLGLAIVRHLVEMHGGSVAAESPGALRGATFTVSLPIPDELEAEDHPFGSRISLVEINASTIAVNVMGLRVLVVDDEVDARDIMVSVLREGGAEVRAVGSAREALDELMLFKPDVLVSDIGMPGEDGHALLRKVRSLPPPLGRIPAVALTAYARPEDARKAFLAGFQMHVSKPVEPAALATVVANLGGRVAPEEP